MPADLPGLLAFTAATALAATHPAPSAPIRWWHRRWFFVLWLGAVLFFCQRHAILANFQLWNPDESEMLAGALKLRHHPIFWRDVDGNSHGPLNQFPLVLPALLGLRIDYTSARVIGNVMIVLMLLCVHRTLADWLPEGPARWCVLPGWAFFIFNQEPELAQYTTELPSCLLLAVGGWSASRAWRAGPAATPAQLFWLGLLCGATPFGKLQSAPMAAWIFLLATFHLLRDTTRTPARRARRVSWLLLAALLPGLFFVGLAAWGDALDYFLIAYLESNLVGYMLKGGTYFSETYPQLGYVFGLRQYVWPLVAVTTLALVLAWRRRIPLGRTALVFAAGSVGSAVFAIYAPHKPFGHYYVFLIIPLVLLLGATAGPVLDALTSRLATGRRTLVAALVLLGLLAPVVAHRFLNPAYFWTVLNQRSRIPTELVQAVQRLTEPDEYLEVWGWRPSLHVYAQTISTTRNIISFWPAVNSPRQGFYHGIYMHDMRAHPPVVFVDTMGPVDFFFFRAGETVKHENFPELAAYIRQHYVLVEDISGARVYLRKDRTDRLPGKL